MYKIHYNDKLIRLCHNNFYAQRDEAPGQKLHIIYPGSVKHIHSYLNKIENDNLLNEICIYYSDLRKLKDDFFSCFRIVKAAGGVVVNSEGLVLFIYRRGSWDLPKGKIDPGESKKEAAVREVVEETGLENVQVLSKLTTTYHIYKTKNAQKRVIKPSYWYVMSAPSQSLTPQVEEDIERADWIDLVQKEHMLTPIYSNILTVLKYYKMYAN